MGYNRATSEALVERMSQLTAAAMNTENGLKIETNSLSEALRLRQQIYAARRVIRGKNPNDTSPISIVELRIENETLCIYKPGAITNKFKIIEIGTEKEIKLEISKNDLLASREKKNFSDEEVFEMMLKLAAKHGPGDYEKQARELLEAEE